MYGIHCTEARGHEAAWGPSAINAMHPEYTLCLVYIYPKAKAIIVTELVNKEIILC